ncbi:hypothetical protein N7510_010558 [Penicillium lagena]|uniref:uncharacterized protein n=1 Tax=Penicillium lagena TaxID=94218 RepID=UPI0025425DFA|nr:uncharacterized protein N7510_010558 [Penicillium lagena]KAJ5601024.1 hypothetical protein N7510_010558 [Penicillium lagena]
MSRKMETRGVRREAVDRKRKPAEADVTLAGGESAIYLVHNYFDHTPTLTPDICIVYGRLKWRLLVICDYDPFDGTLLDFDLDSRPEEDGAKYEYLLFGREQGNAQSLLVPPQIKLETLVVRRQPITEVKIDYELHECTRPRNPHIASCGQGAGSGCE